MKRILLFLLPLIMWSCNKTPDADADNSQPPSNKQQTKAAGDGKYDVWGYGYDATEKYAHIKFHTFRVVDVEAFVRDYPNRIDIGMVNYGENDLIAGINSVEYLKKFNKKTETSILFSNDSKKEDSTLFSGSMSSFYSMEYTRKDKYTFVRGCKEIPMKRIAMIQNDDIYRYVDSEFLNSVNTRSAYSIIEEYGTHVMTGILLGGRVDFLYSSVATHSNKEETAKSGASFNILNIYLNIRQIQKLTRTSRHIILSKKYLTI